MMVAQEIAGLLGETTADTKTTLTKLCHSLLEDGTDSMSSSEEMGEVPDAILGSGAVPLQGVMTAKTQEEQKKTGYIHVGSAAPSAKPAGYVRISSADLKKPGGSGGR